MFSSILRAVYKIINCAEKEKPLELKHSIGRPPRLIKSKILIRNNTITRNYNNPETSLEQLKSVDKCGKTKSRD